jgi:hypothetical protein
MSIDATAPPAPTSQVSAQLVSAQPLDLTAGLTTPRGTDYYLLSELLTDEEREIRDRVRNFVDTAVLPIINDYWERAQFPFELVPKIAQLGVVGGPIQGYGCPGLSRLAQGMVTLELARGDGSVNTFLGVQNGLAMGSINMLGSEERVDAAIPAGQLQSHHAGREPGQAGAAVAGDRAADHPQVSDLRDQFKGELGAFPVVIDDRQHLSVDEVSYPVADLAFGLGQQLGQQVVVGAPRGGKAGGQVQRRRRNRRGGCFNAHDDVTCSVGRGILVPAWS